MQVHQLSKDDLYTAVQTAIDNGRSDPGIVENLERLVWTDAHFDEGQRLLDECTALESAVASARGKQKGATATLYAQVDAVHAQFMDLIVACRGEVTDDALRATLELDAPRENHRRVGPWSQQVERFCATALDDADVWSTLETLGFSRDMFERLRERTAEVVALNTAQSRHRSDRDDLSETLQQVRKELRNWFSGYLDRCRRALRAHPQKLEALGITTPTQE